MKYHFLAVVRLLLNRALFQLLNIVQKYAYLKTIIIQNMAEKPDGLQVQLC